MYVVRQNCVSYGKEFKACDFKNYRQIPDCGSKCSSLVGTLTDSSTAGSLAKRFCV